MTATETVRAQLAGFNVVTGDWILVQHGKVAAEPLPRRSAFVRGGAGEGRTRKPQVVAANVDIVLVVQSLNNGPNLRRLERELVLAFESGAAPVVVLSKADLVDAAAVDAGVTVAHQAAADLDVVVTERDQGHRPRRTACARPSGSDCRFDRRDRGVGKSRLVNGLVGSQQQAVGDVRENDQRGRHTTTARELVELPGGGWLVDTPGMRSVALWEADEGLSRVFSDIETLASQCRFRNCSHGPEPDCAIRAAIASGALDPARFEHYQKLDAELDENARTRQ